MHRAARTFVLILALLALPVWAAAQDPAASQPRLRVETIESGFVIAPDARFTEINDRSATLAGVYGGWIAERTLFAGGGAYWLVDREDDFKVAYGGPIVGVILRGERRLAFGARTLIGFGSATLSDTVAALAADGIRFGSRSVRAGRRGFPADATRLTFQDNFFIVEPQINAIWRVTNWLGVDAGIGYRLVGGSDLLDERLKGLSGSIALQFGR